MKVRQYTISNGVALVDSITGIDFGSMNPGAHCANAVAIKPIKTSETNFLTMKLFLQNKGGFNNSSFGYLKYSSFINNISAGSSFLSDHFTLNAIPSLTGAGAVTLTAATPEFVWLDVQAGASENGFTHAARYQFQYDFN